MLEERYHISIMDRQRIGEIAEQAMATRKGLLTREVGYLLHHGQRVAALSLNLREQVDAAHAVDEDILYPPVFFMMSASASTRMQKQGPSWQKVCCRRCAQQSECTQIAALIRLHNKRGREDLPLAAHILQDADVLDHIGAQSVWLCFAFNAYTENGPHGALAYYKGDENQRMQLRWRALLNLQASRNVFDRRIKVELQFMQRFAREMTGAF